MDMVVEGAVTFDNLLKAISFWDVDEDCENARWIREMASCELALEALDFMENKPSPSLRV